MIVAYDGGAYFGWQDNAQDRSIEEVLRGAIEQIVRHPVTLQAASRTDTGVHAEGQVVNFFTSREDLSIGALRAGIQALVPSDIAILTVWEAPTQFHPTLDNCGKEYHYHLCYDQVQMPLRRHCEWHYPYELDLIAMREAAKVLTGTHNFRAFCNSRKNLHYNDFVRTLIRIDIVKVEEKRLRFELQGTSFLYRMARNIVGTIVCVGRGSLALEALPGLLESGDRTQAGITAPAHGLVLKRVLYE